MKGGAGFWCLVLLSFFLRLYAAVRNSLVLFVQWFLMANITMVTLHSAKRHFYGHILPPRHLYFAFMK